MYANIRKQAIQDAYSSLTIIALALLAVFVALDRFTCSLGSLGLLS